LKLFGIPSGNGVTAAQRLLGQAIDIAEAVLQTTPLSNRLFPGTSEPFAKPDFASSEEVGAVMLDDEITFGDSQIGSRGIA